jgi:hypothetical protein
MAARRKTARPGTPVTNDSVVRVDSAPAESHLYFSRELSWLEFNARVLHEALDPRTRLLERLKFLSIFSSNLDEFYMVRVGGLRRKVKAGQTTYPQERLAPTELLPAIEKRVSELLHAQRTCLSEMLLPLLAEQGVHLLRMNDLAPAEWMISSSPPCSRCSRHSRWIRGIRSPTSRICRSRWRCASAIRRRVRPTLRG